ncbi:hypothetical protein ACXDI1_003865 [Klebsiella pneumoniae]|nr:hypothetical protein [Klebsiella pneumoniae]
MQRLIEIKERLGVIERYLDIQAPFYKRDLNISTLITDLKDRVERNHKWLQRQKYQGMLTEFESIFIEPAINDIYLSSIVNLKRGVKPSDRVSNYISESLSTVDYWISHIPNNQ